MVEQRVEHENGRPLRRGLSLLEVVLALVILATSMVAIGQLMMIGARHSATAQEQARGLQYAQSLLDSAAVGVVRMESTGFTPMDTDPEWEYSLSVQENAQENSPAGLSVVVATVQIIAQTPYPISATQSATTDAAATKPSTVQLTRWIVDPDYIQDRMLNQATVDDEIIEAMIQAEADAEAGGAEAPAGGGR